MRHSGVVWIPIEVAAFGAAMLIAATNFSLRQRVVISSAAAALLFAIGLTAVLT